MHLVVIAVAAFKERTLTAPAGGSGIFRAGVGARQANYTLFGDLVTAQ
jgi:hypothetical protein